MGFAFGDVNVTKSNGERVCRIGGLWNFCHSKQCANHLLHLFLAGVPIARYGRFYLAWRIAEDRQARLCGGQENDASHFG